MTDFFNIGIANEDNIKIYSKIDFTDNPVDVNASIERVLDTYDLTSIERNFYPENTTKIHYLYLDADNKDSAPDTYQWYINYGNPIIRKGIVNVKTPIEKIHMIEISEVIFNNRTGFLPLTGDWQDNQKITVLINELRSQSCINQDGNLFHFRLKRRPLKYNDLFMPKTALSSSICTFYGESEYKFRNPISYLESIKLQTNLPFDPEFYTATIDTSISPITVVFDIKHNLIQQPVNITGFITGDIVADKTVIDAVNQTQKTYIVADDYTIILPINATGINNTINPAITIFISTGLSLLLKVHAH